MMTPLSYNDNDNATPHASSRSSVGASVKFPPADHERARSVALVRMGML